MSDTFMRLHDFNELQQALIKSMYKQVKDRANDGTWRIFKADITVGGQRFNFECKFLLDNMFLKLAHREVRDSANRIIAPDKGIIIPPC
jgi:hypothetical protein